jgi:hypothetical protein
MGGGGNDSIGKILTRSGNGSIGMIEGEGVWLTACGGKAVVITSPFGV